MNPPIAANGNKTRSKGTVNNNTAGLSAGVNVDTIVQNVSSEGVTDISFTVPGRAAAAAVEISRGVAVDLGAAGVDVDDDIAKITIVGAGMKPESGIAARMFRILSDHGINIEMISTSPIRISCVVRGGDCDAALVALHDGFISQDEEGN